jgi:hypothetical protein
LPKILSLILLQDVESPFEVQDYVRSYLGESREAKEFAKQFLEQRSRWRQLQRSVQQGEEDNMCIPAKAVNPGQPTDFHEVKVSSLIIIFIPEEVFLMVSQFNYSLNQRNRRKKCRKWMPVCWDSAFLLRQIVSMSVSVISSMACNLKKIEQQNRAKIISNKSIGHTEAAKL